MNVLFILSLLFISVLIIHARWLTRWGTILMAAMAFTLWISDGFPLLTPPLFFFITASLLTKFLSPSSKKELPRHTSQVLANGGIAFFAGILSLFIAKEAMISTIVGAYAAAIADTWGTEWGRKFGGSPVSLRTFRKSSSGSSGAITLVGSLAGIVAAFLLSAIAVHFSLIHIKLLWFCTFAGAAGSLADSFAGAWIQAKWRDSSDIISETPGNNKEHFSGIQWIDNNVVNGIATITGALVALAGFHVIFG